MAGKYSTPEAKAASLANLRPKNIHDRPPEEAKAICRKGREGQAKAQRRKKALRDICGELLAMECPTGAANLDALTDAAIGMAKERGEPLDVYEAGVLAQIARMLAGDTRAAEFVRDSAGDKPGDNIQVGGDVMTPGDVALLHNVAARLDKQGKD